MRINPSPTVYLLNYADDRFGHKGGHFKKNQEALNASARAQGIENIVSWSWEKLCSTKFYQEHSELLNKNRFENGCAWKPYIVLDLLEKIRDGDIIFCCDCGHYTIDVSIEPLIQLCVRNRGTLFHQWGENNAKWTKRDAFVYMGCDTKRYYSAPALQNSWFLIQKNKVNYEFVKEWLHYNLDERIASYVKPNTCGLPNALEFVENRGDQSIFTNLAIKYRLKTFKGISGVSNRDINLFINHLTRRSLPDLETSKKILFRFFKNIAGSLLFYYFRIRGRVHLDIGKAKFSLYLPDPVMKTRIIERRWIPYEYDLFVTFVKTNSLVFDIGAYTGVLSIPCAIKAKNGQVWAFEPTPSTKNKLAKNARLNQIQNLHTVEQAVSDNTGTAILKVNVENRSQYNTIGAPIHPDCRVIRHSEVTTTTLDRFMKENGISRIDMINADCEGAELAVFKGGELALKSKQAPLILYNLQHIHCKGFKHTDVSGSNGYNVLDGTAVSIKSWRLNSFVNVNELLISYGYQLYYIQQRRLVPLENHPNHQGCIFAVMAHHKEIITPYLANKG